MTYHVKAIPDSEVLASFAYREWAEEWRDKMCATGIIEEVNQNSVSEKLVKALQKCRKKFFEYVEIHRNKHTDEDQRKAVANRELGIMCNEALALYESAKVQGNEKL